MHEAAQTGLALWLKAGKRMLEMCIEIVGVDGFMVLGRIGGVKYLEFTHPDTVAASFEMFRKLMTDFRGYTMEYFMKEEQEEAAEQQRYLIDKFAELTRKYSDAIAKKHFSTLKRVDQEMADLHNELQSNFMFIEYLKHQQLSSTSSFIQ